MSKVFDFIRPSIRHHFKRFRIAYAGAVVSLLGIYAALTGFGVMPYIGISLAVVGALVLFTGIQRGRFAVGNDGAGVVQIVEGQITYFGPHGGGTIALDDLVAIDLNADSDKRKSWVLKDRAGSVLAFPTDARFAEDMFEVFALLENFRYEAMLRNLDDHDYGSVTIWQAPRTALH